MTRSTLTLASSAMVSRMDSKMIGRVMFNSVVPKNSTVSYSNTSLFSSMGCVLLGTCNCSAHKHNMSLVFEGHVV